VYLHATATNAPAINEFIKWTLENHPDVYWISNQKLLEWMKNPTNIQDSLKNPALDCLMPATDPSNIEICDGIDNNRNGEIDEGLVANCQFPESGNYFSTCFGCPRAGPNYTDPAPLGPDSRRPIGDEPCPNGGVYNPLTSACVSVKRAAKSKSTYDLAHSSGNPSDTPSGKPPGNSGSGSGPGTSNDAKQDGSITLALMTAFVFGVALFFE
jgi:hypothetical protein